MDGCCLGVPGLGVPGLGVPGLVLLYLLAIDAERKVSVKLYPAKAAAVLFTALQRLTVGSVCVG